MAFDWKDKAAEVERWKQQEEDARAWELEEVEAETEAVALELEHEGAPRGIIRDNEAERTAAEDDYVDKSESGESEDQEESNFSAEVEEAEPEKTSGKDDCDKD